MKIISRKEAKEKGLKRYFTGQPCKYGHIAERQTSNHGCIICLKNRCSERYWKGRERPEKEIIPEGHKRCTICNKIKSITLFRRNQARKESPKPACKDCEASSYKEYKNSPQGRITYHERQWKQDPIDHHYRPDFKLICAWCNQEFLNEGTPKGYEKSSFCSIKLSYESPQECCSKKCTDALFNERIGRDRRRDRYKNDPSFRDKILESQREYRLKPEQQKRMVDYRPIYRERNKEKVNAYQTKWASEKRKTDVNFKMLELLRKRILGLLKRTGDYKEESCLELIGAEVDDIRNYLESQFIEGMSWNNWTKNGWHLDHLRPCATFDLSDKQQQKVCFNWRNLQPLWGNENTTKRDKYTPIDETEWVERMLSLGYEGELFLKYEEGNSY